MDQHRALALVNLKLKIQTLKRPAHSKHAEIIDHIVGNFLGCFPSLHDSALLKPENVDKRPPPGSGCQIYPAVDGYKITILQSAQNLVDLFGIFFGIFSIATRRDSLSPLKYGL